MKKILLVSSLLSSFSAFSASIDLEPKTIPLNNGGFIVIKESVEKFTDTIVYRAASYASNYYANDMMTVICDNTANTKSTNLNFHDIDQVESKYTKKELPIFVAKSDYRDNSMKYGYAIKDTSNTFEFVKAGKYSDTDFDDVKAKTSAFLTKIMTEKPKTLYISDANKYREMAWDLEQAYPHFSHVLELCK